MAITITNADTECPTGRVGWVNYLVTRSGGTYAWTGAWVNGAYSGAPGMAADGTARSVGSDGVYVGLGTIEILPYDVSLWSADNPGILPDGTVGPTGGYTVDPTDATAVAEIATAAADSGVVSAATTAATVDPPGTYAVRATLDIFGSGGTTPLAATVDATHPATTSPNVASGDWLLMTPYEQGGGVGDYFTVTWTSSDPSVVSLSLGAIFGPADTHLATTITTGASGTATITVSVVSLAAPSPGMVLSIGVTVP